jgi:hypothetical protein
MKRKSRPAEKLVPVDSQGQGVGFEKFSALIRGKSIDKIEKTLGMVSPCEGFRDWFIKFLWHFYRNTLPEARVKSSRTALKKELRTSARRAARLRESAELLWKSGEPSVGEILLDFAMYQPWQSSQPIHPSGIGWIALLDEFKKRTTELARTLSDDKGGPRRAVAFDELLIGLAAYYRTLTRDRNQPTSERQFFEFSALVTDVLRAVENKLPAAAFKLPPTDKALLQRMRRVTAQTSARSTVTKPPDMNWQVTCTSVLASIVASCLIVTVRPSTGVHEVIDEHLQPGRSERP